MELEQELNKRRAAPTDFWIQFILFAIATIIAFFLLKNSKSQSQRKTEKKIAYVNFKELTTIKTVAYGKNKI
jgi:hypothetical protein